MFRMFCIIRTLPTNNKRGTQNEQAKIPAYMLATKSGVAAAVLRISNFAHAPDSP